MAPGSRLVFALALAPDSPEVPAPPEEQAPTVQRPRGRPEAPPEPEPESKPEPEPKREPAPSEPARPAPDAPAQSPPPIALESTETPAPAPGPPHGFAYEPSAGYSTGFMGPAINQSGHFGLFLGGSLPRRRGPRGGRQVAVGALIHAEFPIVMHRHQLAVIGLAGARNRLYWRVSAGLSGHFDSAGAGAGAAIGFTLPFPAERTMVMAFSLTCFGDWASAFAIAPGAALSVVRL